MATTIRAQVEQDMTQHALGHIFTKLNGLLTNRTTFVIVEGSDDLAFYGRFFDEYAVSAYYSTKLNDDGTINTGGCEELQNVVKTVLNDGRTDKVFGIMDTDYRKYLKNYVYPQNIFHTDCRDMEMTALSTSSVRMALDSWTNGFDNLWRQMIPALRYAGTLRILNDKFKLGCNFNNKCKIDQVFDIQSHQIVADWKPRYNKAFVRACLNSKNQTIFNKLCRLAALIRVFLYNLFCNYSNENLFDICHGHDTIHLLSLCLVKTHKYSELAIWEKCFDAYTPGDFARTGLCKAIKTWQVEKGLSIFNVTVTNYIKGIS